MKAKRGFLDGYKTYDTSEGFGSASEWRSAFKGRMGYEEAERIVEEKHLTPYMVLGVSANASKIEITLAFRKLRFQYHPDRIVNTGLTKEEAEQKFKELTAAYTVLMGKRK